MIAADEIQQPSELVRLARTLLNGRFTEGSSAEGSWPIAVAVLSRQAIEASLARLWSARAPGLEHAPVRAQLICLLDHIDRRLARETASAWGSLSGACHHHAYELPPTADELGLWIESVERFVAECDRLFEMAVLRSKSAIGADRNRDM